MTIPFKNLVPVKDRKLPILMGPLRGGEFYASPRASMRKVFGVYEHELNPWLYKAVEAAGALLDVGAADGYFSFGCAASFKRAGKKGTIVCFEPQHHYCELLEQSAKPYREAGIDIQVLEKLVGSEADRADMVPLSRIFQDAVGGDTVRTLIKIDVEGAEVDVLNSAEHWLHPRNIFLVEIHAESLMEPVTSLLNSKGVTLDRIEQSPHWLLGREQRDRDNRWLVSAL